MHVEIIIVIIPELVRIELLRPLYHIEIDESILLVEHPGAIWHLLEFLLNTEFIHPI